MLCCMSWDQGYKQWCTQDTEDGQAHEAMALVRRIDGMPSFRNWSKGGGEMSIYEKEGGGGTKPCVHVHKHMYTRGVWGHVPPENFRF